MKKFLFSIVCVALGLISCNNKQVSDNTFDSVTLYYYGYSGMGYTYEVPIRFYLNNKVEAFFILYSTDKDLKDGVYNYNETAIPDADIWRSDITYTDFTFFKYLCKWGDSYIINGTVTVQKNGDTYTFLIDVLTKDGYWHTGKYTGKVKKQNFETQSEVQGFFAWCNFDDHTQYINPNRLPENFQGKVNFLGLDAGDENIGMQLHFIYWHTDPNDPTGVYYVNGNNVLQANYYDNIACVGDVIYLIDGKVTITRVNTVSKYKVEVDVKDENGRIIKEKFDGGYMWLSGYE